MEELPTDYLRGVDFRIVKTSKGGYADYSTSNWARRERALNDAEQAAINQYGLFNLKDFLPKKPGEVELKVMKEMFEASVDGEAFDMERWGQYFKPAGMGGGSNAGNSAPAAAPRVSAPVASAPVAEDTEDAPWEEPKASAPAAPASSGGSEASSRAQDILAKIKARSGQ